MPALSNYQEILLFDMETLDLHGTQHSEVEDKLVEFYFWENVEPSNSLIITGNSQKMRQIVTEWLDKYEYNYYIPSYNAGEIRVTQ